MPENNETKKVAVKKKAEGNKELWRHKPRRRRLTTKQVAYIDNLLKTTTNTDAVISAGYKAGSRNIASSISCQNLNNTNILSALVERIKSGRYDKKIESVWEDCLNDEGNQSDKVSERMDTHRTKLKAVDQIARIGGLVAPTKNETRILSADLTSLLPHNKPAK